MNLKDLLKKVIQLNKLNNELGININYKIILHNGCYGIELAKTRDIKKVEDYYIPEVSNKLINDKLIETDKLWYEYTDEYLKTEKYHVYIIE